MPVEVNHIADKNIYVNLYSCNDEKDRAFLRSKSHEFNELERECQSAEKLGDDEVCFTVATDFLERSTLYPECYVSLVLGPEPEQTILAVAMFAVKTIYLHGNKIRSAFGFLSRTRPSYRRGGAFKYFFGFLPGTFALLGVENCYGYIHKENSASLAMNKHTPIFGEHYIYVVFTPPTAVAKQTLRRLSDIEAASMYSKIYQSNDLMLEKFGEEILQHSCHQGTYALTSDVGTVGVSLWDMRRFGKIASKHAKGQFSYMLCHSFFFAPSQNHVSSAQSAAAQLELMENLVTSIQCFVRSQYKLHHLMMDIDQTTTEWAALLDSHFHVLGRTEEFLSGWGINRILPNQAFIKRFLDPRDFSTLLFFKGGNTTLELAEEVLLGNNTLQPVQRKMPVGLPLSEKQDLAVTHFTEKQVTMRSKL